MSFSLVAGLGNPGPDYVRTRHNLGFWLVDAWADRHRASWTRDRVSGALVAQCRIGARNVWLAKPLDFMNLSGPPLQRLLAFRRWKPSELVVVHDDLTLAVGRLKVSIGGSAGGHNGVQSLLEHLPNEFTRFRLGIGPRAPKEIDLKDFVLGRLPDADVRLLEANLPFYLDGLELLLNAGLEQAMNRLNRTTLFRNDPNPP
jgi:PTH1 family peptidyl-tRNA hydrolase